MPNSLPKPPPDSRRTPPTGPRPPSNWQGVLWYLPMMLLMLWMWQGMFYTMAVKTIPYSEFKQYVAKHEVVECDIKADEIVGVIQPQSKKAVVQNADSSNNATAKPSSTKTVEKQDKSSGAPSTAKPVSPQQTAKKNSGNVKSPPKSAKSELDKFVFRTVRVEDPELVDSLQAAGVRFEGVRPSLLHSLLVEWIIPLGIMFLLWMFLSQRVGAAGQAMMTIGKSRAKLVGEKQTGIVFQDVAGCDEAKYELQEIVDFLKNPTRYSSLGEDS